MSLTALRQVRDKATRALKRYWQLQVQAKKAELRAQMAWKRLYLI